MFSFFLRKIRKHLSLNKIENSLSLVSESYKELSAISSVLRQDERYKSLFWLYDNKDERMDATKPIFDYNRRLFHLSRYEFASEYCFGKNVADIACGTGYGSKMLSIKGQAASVVGIDNCPEAVSYASIEHSSPNVRYVNTSATDTGLASGAIDILVSFETIEHVQDDQALLKEFFRILAPHGLLICSTPNEWPVTVATYHKREYNKGSLVALLSDFFEVELLYNQNSGGTFQYNRGQEMGIIETTDENSSLAECFIAVCRKK